MKEIYTIHCEFCKKETETPAAYCKTCGTPLGGR